MSWIDSIAKYFGYERVEPPIYVKVSVSKDDFILLEAMVKSLTDWSSGAKVLTEWRVGKHYTTLDAEEVLKKGVAKGKVIMLRIKLEELGLLCQLVKSYKEEMVRKWADYVEDKLFEKPEESWERFYIDRVLKLLLSPRRTTFGIYGADWEEFARLGPMSRELIAEERKKAKESGQHVDYVRYCILEELLLLSGCLRLLDALHHRLAEQIVPEEYA